MGKKYEVNVGSYVFQLDEKEIEKIEINENPDSGQKVHFEGQNFEIKQLVPATSTKEGKYWLNGRPYSFKIKNELDLLVDKMGLSTSTKVLSKDLLSPMPGLVFKILVNVGDEVKEGDQLLILEAMKMENVLLAEQDGIIAEINCEEGKAVDKKQALLRFE
ncbi:Biotin-requiring enzyme [Spirosomataceae bacterium TFI 002]|nr:Biotin-requiring enzyme [Spirosomataceae bacterium TFI 002]